MSANKIELLSVYSSETIYFMISHMQWLTYDDNIILKRQMSEKCGIKKMGIEVLNECKDSVILYKNL